MAWLKWEIRFLRSNHNLNCLSLILKFCFLLFLTKFLHFSFGLKAVETFFFSFYYSAPLKLYFHGPWTTSSSFTRIHRVEIVETGRFFQAEAARFTGKIILSSFSFVLAFDLI